MKRNIKYIPAITGCYGMRIWVPAEDTELRIFMRCICLWGNYTDSRKTTNGRELLYELPIGIEENPLWTVACSRLNINLIP